MNCYEEYILQDVLNTCANTFKTEEGKVKTIDELRIIHQKYLTNALDRCLLSAKTAPLNNAVTAVFVVCVKFYKLTKKIKAGETLESFAVKNIFEDLSQKFDTANRILLQVLSKNSQNRRNLQCNFYSDLNSYFSMNFNRYYIVD